MNQEIGGKYHHKRYPKQPTPRLGVSGIAEKVDDASNHGTTPPAKFRKYPGNTPMTSDRNAVATRGMVTKGIYRISSGAIASGPSPTGPALSFSKKAV